MHILLGHRGNCYASKYQNIVVKNEALGIVKYAIILFVK